MIDTDEFRAGMRRLAAGVSIISGCGPTGPLGITATAVTSLTPDPPSVLCCVNRGLALESAIQSSHAFAVNMLRADHHHLARRFAGMDGVRGTEKFDQGAWTTLPSGVPALADSLVTFDCQVQQIVVVGTHSILVGVITAIHFGEAGGPLLYCDGAFGGLNPLQAAESAA
jgi:flavin reductase (DIM6/NTAB) family NADH-FMN oxidoreductase RutF